MMAAPTLPPAMRRGAWVALNILFSLAVLFVSFTSPAASPRTLYLCLLMALCSSPLLWMDQLNGRFTLLTTFLAAFFVYYGAADTFGLLSGAVTTTSRGVLSVSEIAILLGASLAVLGYHVALAMAARRVTGKPVRDWPMKLIVTAGLVFWGSGTLTDWYWQLNFTQNNAFAGRDSTVMLALVFARMLQPIGTIMLGYALVVTRSRPLLLLVLVLLGLQMLVGFIGNTKEIAMRGLIIVAMAAFLVRGRVPKGWLAGGLVFVVFAFPIFQAYRAEVIGVRGMTRAAAAQDIGRSIALALSARDKVESGHREDYRVPGFLERSALKPTMEMMIAQTGQGVEYQRGYTLALYFTGFIPRLIWPNKPDSSVGKLVNREFRVSEDPDTYISATHLGEFYWNFGWPGVVIGMFAFGFLLGFINARCDLSERATLTRLLVLITTIYATIVRFEGSFALEYIVFTRSMVIIGVLHLLFARRPVDAPAGEGAGEVRPVVPLIAAPQLLR